MTRSHGSVWNWNFDRYINKYIVPSTGYIKNGTLIVVVCQYLRICSTIVWLHRRCVAKKLIKLCVHRTLLCLYILRHRRSLLKRCFHMRVILLWLCILHRLWLYLILCETTTEKYRKIQINQVHECDTACVFVCEWHTFDKWVVGVRKSIVAHYSLVHCQLVVPVTTNELSFHDFPCRHSGQSFAIPFHRLLFRTDILALQLLVVASVDAFDRNYLNFESDGLVAAAAAADSYDVELVVVALNFASY